jgi:hypothetical protein
MTYRPWQPRSGAPPGQHWQTRAATRTSERAGDAGEGSVRSVCGGGPIFKPASLPPSGPVMFVVALCPEPVASKWRLPPETYRCNPFGLPRSVPEGHTSARAVRLLSERCRDAVPAGMFQTPVMNGYSGYFPPAYDVLRDDHEERKSEHRCMNHEREFAAHSTRPRRSDQVTIRATTRLC